MIRVFLADDSNAIRAAVRRLLESQSDIEVVGEAEDFKQAIKSLESAKADVLICDIRMPHGKDSQPSHLAELARACECAVIAITFHQADEDLMEAAEQLGAFRVLDKTTLFDTLVPSIREAVLKPSDSRHS
jgi:DNA-binding NarL/FixJ family response regulator